MYLYNEQYDKLQADHSALKSDQRRLQLQIQSENQQ
jgi:hypothetical protein